MSVFICSACLDKIVSNHVKDSCISLINVCSCAFFAEICRISILFLVACVYVILVFLWQAFHSLVSIYL
jgi:hypothetical protein